MTASTERTLFWMPRTLVILLTLFVSVFALDVFSERLGLWGTLEALGMHLIPSVALLIVLAIAWRFELVGGALLAALGVFYIVQANHNFHFGVLLVIGGTPILAGALFWIHWRLSRTPSHASSA